MMVILSMLSNDLIHMILISYPVCLFNHILQGIELVKHLQELMYSLVKEFRRTEIDQCKELQKFLFLSARSNPIRWQQEIHTVATLISSNGTPTALAGENRTFSVSARGDKKSKIARSSSFSRTVFSHIESNKPVGEAFNQTVRRMDNMQYHRGQHPEMDSNGDGNENGQLDFDFTLIPTFSVVCPRRSAIARRGSISPHPEKFSLR